MTIMQRIQRATFLAAIAMLLGSLILFGLVLG